MDQIATQINYPQLVSTIIKTRQDCHDMDEFVEKVMDKHPDIEEETIGELCIAIESSMQHFTKPMNLLDFNDEMHKWYNIMRKLVDNTADTGIDLENVSIFDLDKDHARLMMDTFKVAQQFLKLIMESQRQFINAKKMNDLMEFFIEVVQEYDPEIRSKVMARLLTYDER